MIAWLCTQSMDVDENSDLYFDLNPAGHVGIGVKSI